VADADPVTTEVIRHGLNSAAEQMKIVLRRAAFSPVIYAMIDFCCALYDRDIRLLAQAQALPAFLGTMSFCLESCVQRVGCRRRSKRATSSRRTRVAPPTARRCGAASVPSFNRKEANRGRAA
jgi:hypothetical protein